MQAIAGCLARDSRPITATWLDGMSAALARRSESAWWRTDVVALAATGRPRPDPDDGIAVAADARIDNAEDLRRTLGLPHHAPCEAIIAAAYRRWGDECAVHLLGDFAFILWDQRAERLLCARDAFGVRPLYYYLADRLFAAASTIGAVIALPAVGPELDEAAMADFVAGIVTSTTTTHYAQVRRLPPAHILVAERGGVRTSRYWRAEDAPDVSASEVVDRFRDIFLDSVRSRGAGGSGGGVMLSGGLDSSSIAAVAAREQRASKRSLPTLSLTFDPVSGWNEGPFIDAVVAQGGLDPIFIDSRDHDPVANLAEMLDEQEGPFLGYNASVSRQLYHVARANGLTTLLDGHGGDEVVSHGIGRLNELARAGRWWTMAREAAGVAAINRVPLGTVLAPYASHNRVVRAVRSRWTRRAGAGGQEGSGGLDLVADDLERRTDLAGRARTVQLPRRARDSERDEHLATLASPLQPYALESLDRASAAAGITVAYPFYDRRLVELCVGAPSQTKLSGGLPRLLLRDAMKEILPESVRLRRDKFNFAGELASGLLRHREAIERMIARDENGIGRFVNRKAASSALDRLVDGGQSTDGTELFKVWRTLALGFWLSRPR